MFESHASIFLGIIAALTMHPMASGQGPTAVQTASEPAADLFPTLTNDLNALSIDVTQASDRMVAPIGDLTINSPNGRLIRLINKTSHSIKIAEMKISCGCVQAVNDGLSAQPGQALDNHFSLRPTLQTNTFRLMVSIRFDGPNESIIQLHLEGHVKNLVDVEPASLNFNANHRSNYGQVYSVTSFVWFEFWNHSSYSRIRG